MNEVIDQLYKSRMQKGITLLELANHLGITEGALSHWERFRRRPSYDALSRWATYLGFELKLTLSSHEERKT
jgi:transcriptional regulator with XRE-family HTH domain